MLIDIEYNATILSIRKGHKKKTYTIWSYLYKNTFVCLYMNNVKIICNKPSKPF